jgi:hypothetical protein
MMTRMMTMRMMRIMMLIMMIKAARVLIFSDPKSLKTYPKRVSHIPKVLEGEFLLFDLDAHAVLYPQLRIEFRISLECDC